MKEQLTMKSRIKELYRNPVGHDVIHKILLQMNLSPRYVTNPLVQNLKLSFIQKLMKNKLEASFFLALLDLLNSEKERYIEPEIAQAKKVWWKEAVFYQIYPRSFYDSNGDGIGDIRGIIKKLDYLQNLGVDAIWLSPIYDSPNDDNGYDIRDYYQIMQEFGTMEDFDYLLKEVHQRGMRLIMDLVVNHTSDEHHWFQEALHDPSSKYRDYYFFQDGEANQPPNNWTSFFSGSAWNYYGDEKVYALHLFSKKQMDLNWESKELRGEIQQMISWWLKKGVDGFRMDVINYISKQPGLPEGNKVIGELMGFYGIEHYFYGPKLHTYLKEIQQQAFGPNQAFSVGEMPGIGLEMGKLITGEGRDELDLFFSFDHLENPGKTRFDPYLYDLNYLKSYLANWNKNLGNYCQMTLFYNNHDNPRFSSKVNPKPEFREVLAKLLAGIQLTQKGTPFIFQGDELGLVNKEFHDISELKDIESLNLYEELIQKMDKAQAFEQVLSGTRDHARTPMQWDDSLYGGFSSEKPWLQGDQDYLNCNVKQQLENEESVFYFYQKLMAVRKSTEVFTYGETEFLKLKKKDLFYYIRSLEGERYLVECNLSEYKKKRLYKLNAFSCILSNAKEKSEVLLPYEFNLYRIKS